MEFIRQLREAAQSAPANLHNLLARAVEEFEMLKARFDSEDSVMHEVIREAILNERAGCATHADQAASPAFAEAIRSRPAP